MQTATVADFVCQQLAQWGVRRIYGVAGDAILPLLDALGRQSAIQYVSCRHEAAAAMMASAEAKLTGNPAVCTATSGPGLANMINGLADAHLDRVPVIALTGQVETRKLGGDYKQFIRQPDLVSPLCHYTTEVANPEAIGEVLHKAFVTAMQRKGVAHLGICKDTFFKTVTSPLVPCLPQAARQVKADKLEWEHGAEKLAQAKKIAMLVGGGARRVQAYVSPLAERLNAAVLLSLGAKGIVPEAHPLVVGGLGEGGSKAAMQALEEADLLLILGATWFPRSFIPDHLSIVQVDENPEAFHPHPRLFPVLASLEETLPFWLQKWEKTPRRQDGWGKRVAELHDAFWQETELMADEGEEEKIRVERLIRAMEEHVDRDAIVTLDTGEHTVWFNRMFRAAAQQPVFSGKWRTMGFALPAAIAAAHVHPGRQVVALVGDGGLLMCPGELMTLAETGQNVTVVVVNNQSLGLEEAKMKWEGLTPFGTRIATPDFVQMAQAFGLRGFLAADGQQLGDALREALSCGRPALVNVCCTGPTLRKRKADMVLTTRDSASNTSFGSV